MAEEVVASTENGVAEANGGTKKSKADKRKEKKQKQKQNKQQRRQEFEARKANEGPAAAAKQSDEEDVVIEYVSAPLEFESEAAEDVDQAMPEEEHLGLGLGLGFAQPKAEDPMAEFKKVFERFASAEQVTGAAPLESDEEGEEAKDEDRRKEAPKATTSDSEDDELEEAKKKLSKKQRKLMSRMKIAELKKLCERPEVVEVWDITAPDPQLLAFLKAYRNTVSVPRHWSQKRKYLQGKRGIEKPPFKLPDFIEATGITEMRNTYQEKEDSKKMKQKLRERMAPKMGRMDIDYQVLHDAFFKFQTKPKLSALGEMYYEGKEFEARIENVKPGVLSDELRNALGMSEGAPPPWLINMQRYGPPPSYPNLKVAGLNAPIPPGAQFGYQPGGWGKPPVDEEGNPLYGDVFGQDGDQEESDDEVDTTARWGELEVEVDESSEEEEEEEEEEQDEDGMAEGIASGLASGMVSGLASGIASSLPSGIETPDVSVQLRKGSESSEPRQLYTVLEQRAAPIGASTLLGTDHVYVIPPTAGGQPAAGAAAPAAGKKGRGANLPGLGDVEVTLTPEEMEGLDEAGLKALYDEKLAEARAANKREDFSDMVAAKAAQQKRKMLQKQEAAKKQKTGAKDFKF